MPEGLVSFYFVRKNKHNLNANAHRNLFCIGFQALFQSNLLDMLEGKPNSTMKKYPWLASHFDIKCDHTHTTCRFTVCSCQGLFYQSVLFSNPPFTKRTSTILVLKSMDWAGENQNILAVLVLDLDLVRIPAGP